MPFRASLAPSTPASSPRDTMLSSPATVLIRPLALSTNPTNPRPAALANDPTRSVSPTSA